jgi:hypothetical protein
MSSEVSIWPSLMIDSPRSAFAFVPSAQDASQSLPDPLVQRFEGRPVAVLEVSKPAGERAIDVLDDLIHPAGS